MKKVKKEESLLKWAEDSMEFVFKGVAVVIILLSVFLAVRGLVILHKYDYMSFFEICFMSKPDYDFEIMKNNTLFIECYNGYALVMMAFRCAFLSFAWFVLARFWGATTRIKHLYRTFYGKDLRLELY